MATWLEISADSFRAAKLLLDRGHYRSSVNRAYYGMYAAITHKLILSGHADFANGRPNPSHEQAMQMFEHNVLGQAIRRDSVRRMTRAAVNARRAREVADYIPGQTVDHQVALLALRNASLAATACNGGGA